MKFWKAFCALCLALTMALSLAACTDSKEPTEPVAESTAPTEEATEAPTEEITEAPTEEETEAPTEEETEAPTEEETEAPTEETTEATEG